MTNEEKIKKIQAVIDHPETERIYYGLLEDLGDLQGNYTDYMTTEPIKCNEELQRVKNADYANEVQAVALKYRCQQQLRSS